MPLCFLMAPTTSNAGWLLFAARVHWYQRDRELRACVNGRARRLVRIAGGADPNCHLRQSIRERLADGRLFRVSGVSVERRGTGQPCVVCGQVIERSNPEREVEEDGRLAVAHDDCYRLWREECRQPTT
jgi:hypothetical protein